MTTTPSTLWVLAMGGTIAGQAAIATDQLGYRSGALGAADLLAGLPLPAACEHLTVRSATLAHADSKDMDHGLWQRLLEALVPVLNDDDVAGVVITHGTDTLEETAFFVHHTLALSKPVVFTCAMRPATGLSADGPQNLMDAMTVAATPNLRGAMVAVAGQVHAAAWAQKVHPHRLHAFDSGDHGPLGWVAAGAYRPFAPCPVSASALPPDQVWAICSQADWPWVAALVSHADADSRSVEALLACPDGAPAGLVVGGTGNGTVHHRLSAALQAAQRQGVAVWLTTRCAYGEALPRGAGHDTLTLTEWPLVKARLALQWALMRMKKPPEGGLGTVQAVQADKAPKARSVI